LAGVEGLAAGGLHSLALKSDGTLAAWGANSNGQVTVPTEARHVQTVAAGEFHTLALCQAAGFPRIVPASPVTGWPGQHASYQTEVTGAVPSHFSTMGLPPDLTMDSATGVIEGVVITGERRVARISVDTDKGRLTRMLWINTADGNPPTSIVLQGSNPLIGGQISVLEGSPEGTLLGTLSAVDPDPGDSHSYQVVGISSVTGLYGIGTSGNQLIVASAAGVDYESNGGTLTIRVRVEDSGMNYHEEDFVIQVLDDRSEDFDGDGVSEALEEDVYFTSDLIFDDFSTSDPDKDGIPSIVEYAFHLDMQASDAGHYLGGVGSDSGLPICRVVVDAQGHRRLRMEYLRRMGSGLNYQPEFSSDLNAADWAPANGEPEVIPVNPEWERCVIDDDEFTPSPPKRFGRISISQ
jgi:hypothetical protein